MYIIAAFRSRNSAMRLYDILRKEGVRSEIINTPREAQLGCGLSLRFEERDFERVKIAAMRNGVGSLAGYFLLGGCGCEVKRIF